MNKVIVLSCIIVAVFGGYLDDHMTNKRIEKCKLEKTNSVFVYGRNYSCGGVK